jgi:hypothetical protein
MQIGYRKFCSQAFAPLNAALSTIERNPKETHMSNAENDGRRKDRN